MRILLVEDHPQLAESVVQALRAGGWTVDLLNDGVAADLALSTEDYALAILDVGLPRLDGFQVLSRLRKRGKTLPVLMLEPLWRDQLGAEVSVADIGRILDDIEAHDYDVFSRRAHLDTTAKLRRLPGIWVHGDFAAIDEDGQVAFHLGGRHVEQLGGRCRGSDDDARRRPCPERCDCQG
mgnify:CR=1 FL=1